MAVHIRLRRMGKKKRPYYRIVAADSRRARDGRFLETVGTYNPILKPAEVKLFEDRVTYWLNQGAQPSDTVSSLFTQVGFTEKYLRAKKGEDVSEVTLATAITERRKKTRKMKKAAIAAAEAAPKEADKPAESTESSDEGKPGEETKEAE